jgi:hypothetical protein
MNSTISSSRLLAAALCGVALAACNAVEDVRDGPHTALPAQTAVLGGTIKDLGTVRPLILQNNGQDTCLVLEDPNNPAGQRIVGECRFVGVQDQEYASFSFGALTVGSPYNITVKKQPAGKTCTIANPAGVVGTGDNKILVTCVSDSTPRYTVTANIDAAARSKAGLKVVLTTENGTCPVDVNGQASVTFTASLCPSSATGGYHQNAASVYGLPIFGWRVTAFIPGDSAVAPVVNCFVSDGPVANTGGNVQDNGSPSGGPTGNVTVTVKSCGFAVRAQADYFPAIASPPAIPATEAVSLLLRKLPSGTTVAVAKITSFANTFVSFMVPDAQGEPTATAYEAQSDTDAFYEVVVKSSPTGMACIPGSSFGTGSGATSTRTVGNWTDAGAVLLRRPASAYVKDLWLTDRVIRCRLVPATAPARVRGVYRQDSTTTTTRTVGTAAPLITAVTTVGHNYLAFFEDGSYLYGNHVSGAASNGVEQGFYDYNNTTAQLLFTGFTDTNGSAGLHSSATSGNPTPRTLTSVVKGTAAGLKTFTARFSTATTTGLVLGAGDLSVRVNNATTADVAAAGYTSLATLATAINTAAGNGLTIATVSGDEILITGPAGGVVIGGARATGLGFGEVAAGATATSSGVGVITRTVVKTDVDWILTEAGPDTSVTTTNPVDGPWVSWDPQLKSESRRRIFVYQHGLYTALHIGVNGIGNLQQACYVGNVGLVGTWTRQGGRSGCNMRVYTNTVKNDGTAPTSTFALLSSGSADIPNPTATLQDYPGRWPQSQNPDFTDGRPYSLVDYEIRPAGSVPADPICPSVDKLTVWDTANGVRKDQLTPPIPPIVMCRIAAN